MAVYRTTFPIGASADTVWDILADFERYPEWNTRRCPRSAESSSPVAPCR